MRCVSEGGGGLVYISWRMHHIYEYKSSLDLWLDTGKFF